MKKLLALALALAMVLSIGSALADDKVTVTFWYSLSGTNAEAIKTIVDLYNESQDKVFVDAQYQGEYDDAINKFGQAFAGGAKPCDGMLAGMYARQVLKQAEDEKWEL